MVEDPNGPAKRTAPPESPYVLVIGRIWTDFRAVPAPGWIRIAGARIAEVGEGRPPAGSGEPIGHPDSVVLPGFTDAHVHLPQFGQRGIESADLLTWLDTAILPAEARWSDPAFAEREASSCLQAMLRAGTVRAAAFLTSHAEAPSAVTAAQATWPVDLLAGVSLMDREVPRELRQPEGSPPPPPADPTDRRLRWSVNPRFAVSCSDAMLERAGRIAKADDRFVHTHLSEQVAECRRVAELFPASADYVDVYDRAGLLGPRTLLAHAIHLSPREWTCLADRDAVVVHCPGANTFLESGLFDLRAARSHGVRVALGSDVAAGPDLSMPRVARAMTEVARVRRLTVDPDAIVPAAAEAWSMITAGNADAVGRPGDGRLAAGAAADLLLIRPDQTLDDHVAGRLLHAWDDDWIESRIVGGEVVDLPSLV